MSCVSSGIVMHQPANAPAAHSDHRVLDARSLALHCKIKRKIDQQPELIEKPRRNLVHWSESASGPSPAYIWERL